MVTQSDPIQRPTTISSIPMDCVTTTSPSPFMDRKELIEEISCLDVGDGLSLCMSRDGNGCVEIILEEL